LNKAAGRGRFYVKYEMWLRKLNGSVNSWWAERLFFCARREVCEDSPRNAKRFRTLLPAMRKGMRGISDPRAVGYYQEIKDKSREFDRKVRTVIRGLTVFFRNSNSSTFSSSVCFRISMSATNFSGACAFFSDCRIDSKCVVRATQRVFLWVLAAQVIFYGLALAGILAERRCCEHRG